MTTDHTPPAELAQRLGAIRQQMAAAASDRPTPQQLADWDEFDRNMAARIQKARPGIPLHHAYATLQTLRAIQQAEAPAAVLPPPVFRADVLDRIREVVRRLAAHAVGFQDVLDESDHGPWGKTVAVDIAELRRMIDEAQPDDTVHTCPGRWGGPDCTCFDDEALPARCEVKFEGGDRCAKPAGHRPPGSQDPHVPARADEAQPGTEAERVVAYRSLGGRILRCLNHIPPEPDDDFVPVTSDDLPDGGVCTYPECGVDVLIPQPGAEAHSCPNCEGVDPDTCLMNPDRQRAPQPDVEHCVHDRAVHQHHHHTPVDGCPWCAASVEARS